MRTTGNLNGRAALIIMYQTLLALPTPEDRSVGYASAVVHESLSGKAVAGECTAIFWQRNRFESRFIHFLIAL